MTTPARWQSVWRQLGATDADSALFQRLVDCYSEPHRKYHTLQHLEECFALLDRAESFPEHLAEVELALWFHDAIYNTRKGDNEKRSAEWARESILDAGLSKDQSGRIYELIMATKHNALPVGRDAEVLVDVDLGILGAEQTRFDEYENQVRQEYSWVPEFLYRRERRKVLEQFLNRSTIYSTEYFRDEFEARARDNLARSLTKTSLTYSE
jgi:predicted metal-dependent HD superfamily phosphohydrolase